MNKPGSELKLRGVFRLNIVNPDGTIAGDSGWIENQVTDLGKKLFLADNIGKTAGSKQVGYVALGTGTMPGASDTTLNGEIMDSTQRKAVSYSNVSSYTAEFQATFASSDNFLTGASNIRNIGLFHSTETNETLFAGYTFDSSSCDTNQNVNVTYQVRFT